MRSGLVTFLALFLLQALIAQANHILSPWHIYLVLGGLYIPYAALMLPVGPGLAAVFLAGLVCDAAEPVPFGMHAFLFAAAHLLLHRMRDRVPREDTLTRILAALLVNLAFFVVLSFVNASHLSVRPALAARLASDLLCSQAALALIAPWFFGLQERALALAQASPRP